MALSPYSNKSRVRRSASFSSSNTRSFFYQEVFTADENGLERSFSRGKCVTRGESGETVESTQIRVTSFTSPGKRLNVERKRRIRHRDMRNRPENLPIEFPAPEKKTPRKTFCEAALIYLNVFTFIICCSVFIYRYKYCDVKWEMTEISHKLNQSVFGQDKVLMELVFLLEKFNYFKESMVISFIGGIGVGKTLVANVIQDGFPWRRNKHLHFFDSNTEKILSGKSYSSCGANLVVIDDLNVGTVKRALNLVEKTSLINSKVLFILIFQSHSLNDFKYIIESLDLSKVKIHHLAFNDLNHSHVKKCFTVELSRQGKYLPDKDLNMIVNEHMKYCNISRSYLGCKNVLNEVSLLEGNV